MNLLVCLTSLSATAVPKDLFTSLPGFPSGWPFKAYSGFLNVEFVDPKAVGGYDAAVIHYQFHTARNSTASDKQYPVVAWHTGGPGGSSIYGQYAEIGYFQVNLEGQQVNPHSWNNVANVLFLESPAGSFLTPDAERTSGFSYCLKQGQKQRTCSWNDKTQAVAYAQTLQAFYKAYPEYASHDLYLAGESYAGQYIPNIAAHIVDTPSLDLPLKGIAVGNGCWGGDEHTVECNGPNENRDMVELYYGKGLVSKKLYDNVMATCEFPRVSLKCRVLLGDVEKEAGPHNVYNIYDNCPGGAEAGGSLEEWSQHTGKSLAWLGRFLRRHSLNATAMEHLRGISGGYDWTCGQFAAIPAYFEREEVRSALHMPKTGTGSHFDYSTSGPASVTLYPDLIRKLDRVLIYNGDADTCVPYVGNEEWTSSMVTKKVVTEIQPWHPWYVPSSPGHIPAGYATTYSNNFTFVTIRLAGHQVPKNMPVAALQMITNFLTGQPF